MFKIVNQGTKKAQQLIDDYNYAVSRYGYRYLRDCYDRYSRAKELAEKWIIDDIVSCDGFDYTVMSYNTFGFTCGYLYADENTGELMLRVETPKNTYVTCYA